METANRKERTAALICMLAVVLLCVISWLNVWQTRYQLVSPLIPDQVVADIQRLYRVTGIGMLAVSVICSACYRLQQYKIVIVLAVTAVIAREVYMSVV